MQKRSITINSNLGEGTDSKFTYMIDMKGIPYNKVCLTQAIIPKSYYLIDSANNTFTLQEGMDSVDIQIPIGNYSRESFMTKLTSLMNTHSPNNFTYSMTVPNTLSEPETGLFYYGVSGNSGVQPSIILGDVKCAEQMGFEKNSTNTFVNNALVSTNIIKMQKEDAIYVRSNICSGGGLSAGNVDNVLQEIFAAETLDFGNIVWTCPDVQAFSRNITTSNDNKYEFWLTDEDGKLIDLNGRNMILCLLLYKEEPNWLEEIFAFIRQYARYSVLRQSRK